MKKLISTTISMIMISSISSFAYSYPKLIINGDRIFSDVNPIIENGRTLVPIRVISEELGASVNYKNGNITIKKDTKNINLKVNNINASINGVSTTLDVPAKILKERTLVPIRFISEALGTKVEYNSSTKEIIISEHNFVDDSTYKIGTDLPAGEYVLFPKDSGYFSVNEDYSGNNIIFNDFFSYPRYVTVTEGTYLELKDITIYPIENSPSIQFPSDKYTGYLKVGKDIPAGNYTLNTFTGEGYFAITDKFDDIIQNDFFSGKTTITLENGQYLQLSKCYIPR